MLNELISALEKATGPDRELDARIAVATFDEPYDRTEDLVYAKMPTRDDDCAPGTFWRKSRSGLSLHTAPRYTESIDAALTLVPEGGGYRVGRMIGCQAEAQCHYRVSEWENGLCTVNAATPALALCIAALRARSGC